MPTKFLGTLWLPISSSLALAAVVLGIVGLFRRGRHKHLAVVGLLIAGASLLVLIPIGLLIFAG